MAHLTRVHSYFVFNFAKQGIFSIHFPKENEAEALSYQTVSFVLEGPEGKMRMGLGFGKYELGNGTWTKCGL